MEPVIEIPDDYKRAPKNMILADPLLKKQAFCHTCRQTRVFRVDRILILDRARGTDNNAI